MQIDESQLNVGDIAQRPINSVADAAPRFEMTAHPSRTQGPTGRGRRSLGSEAVDDVTIALKELLDAPDEVVVRPDTIDLVTKQLISALSWR